jgi:hypothetical protein
MSISCGRAPHKHKTHTQSDTVIILPIVARIAIDRSARLGVSQNACVVDERRRAFIRRPVKLNEKPLDVKQISLERVEIPAGLQVFRRRAPVVGVVLMNSLRQ